MSIINFIKRNISLVVALLTTAVFLVANSLLLLNENYSLLFVPFLGMALVFFIVRYETALLSIAFLTPFAINVSLFDQMQLSLPSEPMMILCTIMFLFRVLAGDNYDRRILKHPVTILLICSIVWMFITSLFSVDILTSIKYTLARIWFVTPFFFACVQIFQNKRRIRQLVWGYTIALCVVIAITTFKTLGHFHELQMLHRVMKPFYNDHTAYGCAIALVLPIVTFFIFEKQGAWKQRIPAFIVFSLLLTGVALSYCRAAWMSLLISLGIFIIIKFRIDFRWIILAAVAFISIVAINFDDISISMQRNRQDSSLDLSGQIQSISNISTDASNLERLNRWSCALKMFAKDPILGWGPGTYQFNYAPFQESSMLTIISTNAGDNGNAHSEYLGPLAEQGILGCLLVIAVFGATFVTGIRLYKKSKDRHIANLALAFTLCLTTYYIHAFFNNFLDTDKLSLPFWAFTAAIVSLDIYSKDAPDAPSEA